MQMISVVEHVFDIIQTTHRDIKMTSKRKQSKLSVTFHPTELYNLCNIHKITCTREEAFERIREWLHRNKDNKTRLKEALTYKGENNHTPLHNILEMDPPLDIIQKFIDYAPETLQMKDIGYLPIHIACLYGACLEVIRALVYSYPDSIKEADNYGDLPLHCAFFYEISLDVLNFLIESYPEGLDKKDSDDETPLDCLKESEYVMHEDNNGMLPLHHACKNGYSLHLIHLLIQAYPESTNVQDNDGYTPLQYLNKTASCIDDRGMLLLHREAAHSKGLCVGALPFLLEANPEAVGLQDKSGWLPLHHAILNEASSVDALMLLVKFYPESILV